MTPMENLAEVLDMLNTRAAEFKAFDRSLKENTQALIDVVSRPEVTAQQIGEACAMAAASMIKPALELIAEALAALAARQPPAAPASWTTIEVSAPLDSMGRPSGKMTLKKVA